jgi:hypothetical protein
MQKVTEELPLDDGRRTYRLSPNKRSCLVIGARHYSFELFRKAAKFGDRPVDQFWMSLGSVYGRKGVQARNYDVIVEYYRERCQQAGTVHEDGVYDSYVLAKLLPYVRRNGSRRVFDDAILTSPKQLGLRSNDLIRELDRSLAASRGESLDILSFHRATQKLLGAPEIPAAAAAAYQALAEELLGDGCRAVRNWGEAGMQIPVGIVQRWMSSFARHRGQEEKKLALDMLSYECRAAMHRCYSAVWFDLLTHLERKYELDEASVQFHRLMHFDVQLPAHEPNTRFHLFHGHIFALHPGLSLFFQTPTGGKLIEDYLCLNDADRPFRRLLRGFQVALSDYYVRSELIAESRKKSGCQVEEDLDALAARQTRGRGHRRLHAPGHSSEEAKGPQQRASRSRKRRRSA